jgi:hypothetical protein
MSPMARQNYGESEDIEIIDLNAVPKQKKKK